MRIRSIGVRYYRIHRELKIDLDPARTLIAGPNESGKSTLIEAAHRAFFLRARTTGEAHRSMMSRWHAGHPEVEVWFEAAGKVYRILKRFSGANGTATLTELDGEMWSGENAEARLAELVGVEWSAGKGAAERAAMQWAHLWIWQGCAGDDPTEHVNRECAALLARLQEEGGAAIMQSESDAHVADEFARRHDELFNRNGEPRAASELARALADEAAALEACADAGAALRRLRHAAEEVGIAEETISDCQRILKRLAVDDVRIKERLARVAVLRRAEESAAFAAVAASEKHDGFAKVDERIRQMQSELTRRTDALTPVAAETVRLVQAEAECREAAAATEETYQRANAELRELRMRRDFLVAHATQMEKAKQRDELAVRFKQVGALRAALRALGDRASQLPKAGDLILKEALEMEKHCSTAQATLEAMATGIDLVASDTSVQAGERLLREGESLILAEETELKIGDAIRIRIRPGGGTSLERARSDLANIRATFREKLAAAGFASVAQLAEANAAWRQLEVEMETVRARLDASGADTMDGAMETAAAACREAEDALEKCVIVIGETSIPATLPEAEALLRTTADLLRKAEANERTLCHARNAAAATLREMGSQLVRHRERVALDRRAVSDLEAQLRMLVESHGQESQRAQVRRELHAQRVEAENVLRGTRGALEELRPEELMREEVNHAQALAAQRMRRIEAEQHRAVARAVLQRDGTVDPHADAAVADARLAAACERREVAQRKADAVRLLRQLFLAEQKELAERFTRPLAAKISNYLECVFGSGAEAGINLEANRFTALRLIRHDREIGAYDFANLSGGTCEQVAAAVRLAMAELLASAHDDCLPVVFDDAFVYSDPERVRVLQRMLELGASRGLQIIALTCNPADYAGFGAKMITLNRQTTTDPHAAANSAPADGETVSR